MSQRDPRIDPHRGDVLRNPATKLREACTYEVSTVHKRGRGYTVHYLPGRDSGSTFSTPLTNWRFMCREAEVIQRAEEGGSAHE